MGTHPIFESDFDCLTEMEDEAQIGPQTIKVYGDSVGVTSIPEEAAKWLSSEVTFLLKEIVQDASKFMRHSYRQRLTTHDIDAALRARRIEPLYGFTATEYIPLRYASGGGRELHFNEDSEVDLANFIEQPAPKIPAPVKIRAHWLVIDGVQPSIPENPAPAKKPPEELILKKTPEDFKDEKHKDKFNKDKKNKDMMAKSIEQKPLLRHELSLEQMKYYAEITQAAVGRNEEIRKEALTSLSQDTGIHSMLPRFTNFISEGIKCNINENNLALVIYLMRMVKALLDNPTLSLDMYLHELIPVVISCVVSKQLCNPLRAEENHWALRSYASRVLSLISKNFTTTTTLLQSRIVESLSKPLANEQAAFAQVYGSLVGLAELGPDVIRRVILPKMRKISDRIEAVQLDKREADRNHGHQRKYEPSDHTGCGHIETLIKKQIFPEVLNARQPPDIEEQYQNDYGNYFGRKAYQYAIEVRNQRNNSLMNY